MTIVVLVVLVILLIVVGLATTVEDSVDAPPHDEGAFDAHPRVNELISALNYGTPDTVEATQRRLLSMGPAVAGELFDTLLRLDASPDAFTPATQLRVEDVIADFGLAGYLAMRDRFDGLDDAHPAYAGALRVFERIGVLVVEQLLRERPATVELFLDPLVIRMAAPVAAYLERDASRLPSEYLAAIQTALRCARREAPALETVSLLPEGAPRELDEAPDAQSPAWIAWAARRLEHASTREALMRRLSARGPHWPAAAAVLADVAPDDVVSACARHFREAAEEVEPAVWCALVDTLGSGFVRAAVDAAIESTPERAACGRAMLRRAAGQDWVRVLCARVGRQRAVRRLAAAARAVAEANATDALVDALDDPDVAVRAGAIRLCGRLWVSEATPGLVERASAEPDARRLAAIALETLGSEVLPSLLEASRREDCPREVRRSTELVKGAAERRLGTGRQPASN